MEEDRKRLLALFDDQRPGPGGHDSQVTLFLGGDVMTGRGVDQILDHPSPPDLHEPFVRDARDYVRFAEAHSGPIPRPVDPRYIWGDALAEWERVRPAVRIVNLETSVTRRADVDPGKGIHYRMHPANVACLRAAGLDVCVLANNHVLDYGRAGLVETLDTLSRAGLPAAGAGRDLEEAQRPVVCAVEGGGRVMVVACAHGSSGVPWDWAALPERPGVYWLPDLTDDTASDLAGCVTDERRAGDVAAVSLHWGDNWGYDVPDEQVAFAHRLVDEGVDLVYCHSSHHPRPLEIYRDRLILYGCGDFIDDYEGITGHERYRDDLTLMFFPTLDLRSGRLVTLQMTALQIRRLRLQRATDDDAVWLCDTLTRVSAPFGVTVEVTGDGALAARSR
jgi:poly-gamma-glutamate capsule biosynthesis protein CapA/YwtB (metallophosphatase superfamily)